MLTMYLKRLEINGFKSFAQKTVLDFLPPKPEGFFTMTAIVGPNGSGKSNITDAIRWVMGETSLKNIRGKKSDDVIFGGSDAKGALSVAEVSMTLHNDGRIPTIEYSEIIITRRLYRSGETEYLINNHAVRLLDIHLLLAQAQFAEHAYSIVSQGMIDRLLTVTPGERKDFFDEASGIKEFQIKRHQAALKLARTEENIAQAEVVIREIEPRLKLLSKQVKKLEQRELLTSELTLAQERYYATLATNHEAERERLTQLVGETENKYRSAFTILTDIQTELSELARAESRQDHFDALQREHSQAVQALNDLERQLVMLEGQLHTEYREAGQHTLAWISAKQSEQQSALMALEQTLLTLRAAAREAAEALTQEQQLVEKLTKQRAEKLVVISRLENALLRGESEQQYRELTGLTAIRAVLEARQQFGTIYGLLGELGQVEERYRLALEVAAGQHLSSLVVKDETVARLAIEYLREQRLGVATFLPLTTIHGRFLSNEEQRLLQESGVVGCALDLVRYDSQFKEIFAFVLGGTIIIEDLKVAEHLGFGRGRLVTLAGDVVEKNGVLRGGFRTRREQVGFSRAALGGTTNIEHARAELAAEKEALKQIETEFAFAIGRVRSAEERARSAETEVQIMGRQIEHLQVEGASVARELALLTASPEEQGVAMARLSTEKETLLLKKSDHEAAVAAVALKISRYNAEEEQKKKRVFELQETMQRQQNSVNAVLAERNDLKVELAKVETKFESLTQEAWNELKMSVAAILERKPALLNEAELATTLSDIEKLRYQLSLIGGIDTEVVNEYKTTKERFDFLTSQLTDLQNALNNLTGLIAELDEVMKKKRASAFKKIRHEFSRYFQILFEGGTADLQEVYGEPPKDDEENEGAMPTPENAGQTDGVETAPAEPSKNNKEKILTGIDVIASPPGKKIKYLNALSGGERTLTSIALICAILHHNPSPFVVLDEVEAALDEANTQRFVRIMAELSKQSQFIIVTHNRVTMHAVDALYGVVMNNDGMSRLFSVKMTEAEKLAETP